MPRRTDLKHVLVIGSGPIVIGQACEFDYSGTQACRVLRSEGLTVSLVNSNPATIMTDPEYADFTYVEPITAEFVENALTDARVALEQYPFDRPTLRSELASYMSDFGSEKAGLGGIVPRHVTASEPYLGNAQFRVGLSGALGA